MENSLLKLSRSYERGSMNKETYRKRRSDLIKAVLDEEESDRTITNRGYMKRHESDPMVEAAQSVVDKPKMNLFIPGGIVALLVVVLVFFLSGDDESDSNLAEASDQPPKSVNMEKIEVLKSYTNEILEDGQLDFDESENFLGRWNYAPAGEKKQWLSDTGDMLVSAQDNGNQEVIEVLVSLYFELDVLLPEGFESMAETSEIASRAMDEQEAPSAVMLDEAVSTPKVGNSESLTSGVPSKAEEVLVQQSQTDQARNEIDVAVATSVQSEVDQSASASPVLSADTSQKSVPIVQQDIAKKQPVRSIPVEPKALAAAPVAVAEADTRSDAEASPAESKFSVDLAVSFLPIQNGSLELESLMAFLKDHKEASSQDKTYFENRVEYQSLQTVYQSTTNELARYNRDLALDNRQRALSRINDIIRKLIKQQSARANEVTSAGPITMSEIRRRPGQNYTIQLFASATEQRVQQLIQENAKFSLYYVKAQQEVGERYFLLEGNYPTKELADTRKLIVPQLEKNLPWVRTNANLLSVMN
ncbi:MAG: septal ring-binding cell division protein DamX [Candidatus Azotimanducaceae bacterium]|jgi:septal ring-binding cell division protein DamX